MRRGGLLPRHASKREVLGDATAALQLIDRLEAVAQPLPVDGTALVNLGSDAFWLGNMWRPDSQRSSGGSSFEPPPGEHGRTNHGGTSWP
jgi:hypothetical protein